jgi:pimeloyl-ACP methyl ester carboxylesterase
MLVLVSSAIPSSTDAISLDADHTDESMTVSSSVGPLYLREGAEPVFGFFHSPSRHSPGASAVLICPPYGWDEICSYRSRRDWANDLAQAGFPTLRIDLPGTGDSGGSPCDPGLLSAWSAAVSSAAKHLRTMSGLDRVAAIGIGLGGLMACRAISEEAPIDELVLWAVPSRGRVLIRELSIFASLEDSAVGPVAEGDPAARPLADGYLCAGGFVMNAGTVQELERLDVCALEFPPGRVHRALMLDRDGISVDKRLHSRLEQSGISVSVASGDGYGAMMAKPHHARAPRGVFARVRSWLEEETGSTSAREATLGPGASAHPTPHRQSPIELSVGDVAIRETPFTVQQSTGNLFGILAEPADVPASELCAVILNAGAIRRIGPNRMWVEVARRWAALGVRTLRLDLEGIGDADGDAERFSELAELYVPQLVDQVCAALDAMQNRGVGCRFVLSGLCSGAYWSFHAARRDERVAAAFMLNPQALFWDESLEAARDLRRGLRSSSWRKLVRREVPLERMMALAWEAPFALPRRALAQRFARRRGENELNDALDELRDNGKVLRFIFSGNEPLYEELERDGYTERHDRWPNVSFEFVPGQVHTLRPLPSQRRAHEALDRALADMLGRTGGRWLPRASR